MIVLRKVKSAKSSKIEIGEPLIGDIDGVNRVFSTYKSFISGKILVTYNGQTLHKGADFDELSSTSIQLKHFAPHPEDGYLMATYEVGM